jgi:hypothetical protein
MPRNPDNPAVQCDDRRHNGQFIKGNKAAYAARGKPKNGALIDKLRSQIPPTATEYVQDMLDERLPELLEKTLNSAVAGDTAASAQIFRMIKLPQRSLIRNKEQLSYMPPDQRMSAISQAAAAGILSLEEARALSELTKNEIEYSILKPLKTALLALKSGSTVEEVLGKLTNIISEMEPIDITPVEDNA